MGEGTWGAEGAAHARDMRGVSMLSHIRVRALRLVSTVGSGDLREYEPLLELCGLVL